MVSRKAIYIPDEYQHCNLNLMEILLVNQPDPKVRCRLAENQYTPKSFLEKLTKDPDLDVGQAARMTLEFG